jgi:signal peptidase I
MKEEREFERLNPYSTESEPRLDITSPVTPEQLRLFVDDQAKPIADPPPPVGYSSVQPVITRSDEGRAFWEEAKSFVRDLVFSVLVAVLVIVFVVQPVRVEGTSMLPHLHDGERIFVNKFIYRFDRIERGDIVVFWYPNDPDKSFIKRVIGLPGETVSIHEGVVHINGQPLDENYIESRYHGRLETMAPKFVQNHYYFVMGDNRDSSNDSRQWGLVPEKYIYGKAIFRYWPPGNVGTIK